MPPSTIAGHGGNIVHAEKHTDLEDGVFFQRIEFEMNGFALDRDDRTASTTSSPAGVSASWRRRSGS